jgi:hypothetical protein
MSAKAKHPAKKLAKISRANQKQAEKIAKQIAKDFGPAIKKLAKT